MSREEMEPPEPCCEGFIVLTLRSLSFLSVVLAMVALGFGAYLLLLNNMTFGVVNVTMLAMGVWCPLSFYYMFKTGYDSELFLRFFLCVSPVLILWQWCIGGLALYLAAFEGKPPLWSERVFKLSQHPEFQERRNPELAGSLLVVLATVMSMCWLLALLHKRYLQFESYRGSLADAKEYAYNSRVPAFASTRPEDFVSHLPQQGASMAPVSEQPSMASKKRHHRGRGGHHGPGGHHKGKHHSGGHHGEAAAGGVGQPGMNMETLDRLATRYAVAGGTTRQPDVEI